jgi:hypothetical protein
MPISNDALLIGMKPKHKFTLLFNILHKITVSEVCCYPTYFQEHSSVGVSVAPSLECYTVAMLVLLTPVCYKGGVWSLDA